MHLLSVANDDVMTLNFLHARSDALWKLFLHTAVIA
jgi:hypothetical protein